MRIPLTLLALAVAVSAVITGCSSETSGLIEGDLYIPESVVGNSMSFATSSGGSDCVSMLKMKVDGLSRRELFAEVKKHLLSKGFTEWKAFTQVLSEEQDKLRRELDISGGSMEDRVLREDIASVLYVVRGNLWVLVHVDPVPVPSDLNYKEKLADGNLVCQQYLHYTISVDFEEQKTVEKLRSYIRKHNAGTQ